MRAHQVHPVIPVSGPHERKAVTADDKAPVQRARTMFKEGGAYLNNERIVDESAVAEQSALVHGRWWLLRRGKKSFASVEMVR